LRNLFDSREDKLEKVSEFKDTASTEVSILLGSIVGIIGIFIAIQIIYLFGGADVVQDAFGISTARLFSYIIMLSIAVVFCFLALKIAATNLHSGY
jgi:hypothetical protein